MKTLRYLILAFLPLLMLSCQEEYVPGEPDLENCYGVWFPSQNVSGTIMLDPADPCELKIKASRMNTDDDIYVPVKIISDHEGIFTMEELYFEDGDADATFSVIFEDAEESVEYSCRLEIVDPQYAMIYGTNPTSISFSVTRARWNKVTAADDLTVTWFDDFIASLYGTGALSNENAVLYEQDGKPGYYRLDGAYDSRTMGKVLYGTEEAYTDVEMYGYTSNASLYIDATDPEKVFLPRQSTGIRLNTSEGYIWAGSYVPENYEDGDPDGYGKIVDGKISFPSIVTELPQIGYMALVTSGTTTLIMPGFRAYDYSLDIIYGHSYSEEDGADLEGKIPFWFRFGSDIESVKFDLFEGSIAEEDIAEYAETVADDANAFTVSRADIDEKSGEAKAVVTPKNPKTGMYTLVAAAYDKNGVMQSNAYTTFGYVKAGDDSKRVICNAGLIVSDKYAPSGLNSENALEFYIHGEDLTQVQCVLFKKNAYTMSGDALINLVANTSPVTKNILNQINNGGYSSVAEVDPGTEYILIVVASNGYRTEYFLAEATTEGQFDPRQSDWTMYDVDFISSKEDILKDWEYWAYDILADEEHYVDQRMKVGTVTITDHEDRQAEPEEGKEPVAPADTICLSGMLGTAGKDLKFDDTLSWQYIDTEGSGGIIAVLPNKFGTMKYISNGTSQTYFGQTEFVHSIGGSYAQPAALIGGPVADGVIAFTESGISSEAGIGGEFFGMTLAAYSDEACTKFAGYFIGMGYMVLIDPVKYPTEKAQSAAYSKALSSPQIQIYRELAGNIGKGPGNCVETWDGGIRSIVENMVQSRKGTTTLEGIMLESTPERVEFDLELVRNEAGKSRQTEWTVIKR